MKLRLTLSIATAAVLSISGCSYIFGSSPAVTQDQELRAIQLGVGPSAIQIVDDHSFEGEGGVFVASMMREIAQKLGAEVDDDPVINAGQGVIVPVSYTRITRETVRRIGRVMVEHPETNAYLIGHSNYNRGQDCQLSQAAVRRVANELVAAGVFATRVGTGVACESEPLTQNEDQKDWERNQRVEVVIYARSAKALAKGN